MAENYRHILLAIDGSPSACRAGERAVALALAARAQLTLVYVVEHEAPQSGHAESSTRSLDAGLEELAEGARKAGLKRVKTVTVAGLAYSRILGWAVEEDVDLIVVGATGAGDSGTLGEVAAHVAKFADASVLIVR